MTTESANTMRGLTAADMKALAPLAVARLYERGTCFSDEDIVRLQKVKTDLTRLNLLTRTSARIKNSLHFLYKKTLANRQGLFFG